MKKTVDEKKLAKLEAKKAAKLKKREAAKAKRLKMLEKHKAQVEANKLERAEKKAKKLAKLEKAKAKKAAIREAKKIARQKKLERLAKQKAKAKELKLKARAKAKAEKIKLEAKAKADKKAQKNLIDVACDQIDIKVAVDAVKKYTKALAKNIDTLSANESKMINKLGFSVTDGSVGFTFVVDRKGKPKVPEVIEPEVVGTTPAEEQTIDVAIEQVVGDNTEAIEKLANEIEEDAATETPIGDTFTDDNLAIDQPSSFEDDKDDDTIDDGRDETDEDKIGFRRDWNNEFGDDGESNDNW